MFHIVENDERHRSLWPDFRKHTLPRGWRYVGYAGSREDCLQRIAKGEPDPVLHRSADAPAAQRRISSDRAPTATASSRPRCVALPFAKADAPLRVFVFPHAGSGASSYHFLARACKDDPVEINLIQYPGREMRIREAPCTDMAAMLASLGDDLRDYLADTPFAFFGHSMGALVAFELTRRLAENGAPLPQQLFLSGGMAPQRTAL
jgi:pimeloyl-ACP methyl ester carboxylesterase